MQSWNKILFVRHRGDTFKTRTDLEYYNTDTRACTLLTRVRLLVIVAVKDLSTSSTSVCVWTTRLSKRGLRIHSPSLFNPLNRNFVSSQFSDQRIKTSRGCLRAATWVESECLIKWRWQTGEAGRQSWIKAANVMQDLSSKVEEEEGGEEQLTALRRWPEGNRGVM